MGSDEVGLYLPSGAGLTSPINGARLPGRSDGECFQMLIMVFAVKCVSCGATNDAFEASVTLYFIPT